jgi:hypothetical protein
MLVAWNSVLARGGVSSPRRMCITWVPGAPAPGSWWLRCGLLGRRGREYRSRARGDGLPAVLRGISARPLFVTAAGMPRTEAADLVRHMAGRFRLPDALRRADTLARTGP